MPPTTHSSTFRTALLPPPGPNQPLILPTHTIPAPAANPPIFNDAMAVRLEVFVDEQKCPAEFEIDEDDSRSWHWVVYDTKVSNPGLANPTSGAGSTIEIPVGVVRLVPPPHASHESFVAAYAPDAPDADKSRDITKEGYDLEHEPYIKFGRVAVLAKYRGSGVARRVMEEAIGWATRNAGDISQAFKGVYEKEGGLKAGAAGVPVWKGLMLVHAQVDVERFYQRLGFATDEELGRWVEEGIEHVGMWKRLDISS